MSSSFSNLFFIKTIFQETTSGGRIDFDVPSGYIPLIASNYGSGYTLDKITLYNNGLSAFGYLYQWGNAITTSGTTYALDVLFIKYK